MDTRAIRGSHICTVVDEPLHLLVRRRDGQIFTTPLASTTWSITRAPNTKCLSSTPCDDASPALDSPAVDLLDKVERILVDSGTRYDMVAMKIAKFYPDAIFEAALIKLSTANGVVTCSKGLLVHYPKLAGVTSISHVLKSTPTLISLGARVSNDGATFIWIPEYRPAFIFPDGTVAILSVIRDCPYLDDHTIQTTINDSVVGELCGFTRQRDGSVRLNLVLPCVDPAAPGLGVTSDQPTEPISARDGKGSDSSDTDDVQFEISPSSPSSVAPGTPATVSHLAPDVALADEILPEYEQVSRSDKSCLLKPLPEVTDILVSFIDDDDKVVFVQHFAGSHTYRTLSRKRRHLWPKVSSIITKDTSGRTLRRVRLSRPKDDDDSPPPDDEEIEGTVPPPCQKPVRGKHNLLTHYPFDPKCDICVRANTREAKHLRGLSSRLPTLFGEIVTCDHKYFKDRWGGTGVRGKEYALVVLDRGTGIKDIFPSRSMDTEAVVEQLTRFKGVKTIQKLYSDCSDAIIAACKIIRAVPENSQPGVPQTNGVIENVNGRVLKGSRSHVLQAGLPDCFWPDASRCFCHHDNITIGDDGLSPWAKYHDDHEWTGMVLPFGCFVLFRPVKTSVKLSSHESRLQPGIFLGYEIQAGFQWNGEYRVVPLSAFANK